MHERNPERNQKESPKNRRIHKEGSRIPKESRLDIKQQLKNKFIQKPVKNPDIVPANFGRPIKRIQVTEVRRC